MTESRHITGKKIAKNLIFSFGAQVLSLVVSFILGFIVPKYISEYQYSYWQTFLLYINYVTLFHFGIVDGIVLRYGQYDYEELDKARIRSQFYLLSVILLIVSCIIVILSCLLLDNVTKDIMILVACGVITKNIFCYATYTLQITNKINLYALSVIVQRAVYAGVILILIVFKVDNYFWYCIADLLGDVCGIVIGLIFTNQLYIGKGISIRKSIVEAKNNIFAGIFLTIASFSGGFIITGARTFIQWNWDALTFGQLSFSFSVSMAFVSFATAISVVLFPSLKRMNVEDLPKFFSRFRSFINFGLFGILILYFPGVKILEIWLPNYSSSLVYLGILLPMIIFYSRLSLLTNNYLKAYRFEKFMMAINFIAIAVAVILFIIGSYGLHNIDFILYSVVFSIMLRSVVSEIVVAKKINVNLIWDFIIEFVMTVAFILAVRFLTHWWACLAYACALAVYAVIYRKSLISLFRSVGNLFRRNKKQPEPAGEEGQQN